MTKRRSRRRKVFRTQEAEGVGETRRHEQSLAQAAQPVTSEAEQDTLRGVVQVFVKTLTGKTTTFDVEGQCHHRPCEGKGPRQGRHSSRPAVIDLRRKAARRQEDTVGQQRPEGKFCVARHQ